MWCIQTNNFNFLNNFFKNIIIIKYTELGYYSTSYIFSYNLPMIVSYTQEKIIKLLLLINNFFTFEYEITLLSMQDLKK